ncbi:MAG: molybdate ABC transporter permease subunit [Desulfatitalea sp.]|nr:molybdate ABC transporter permease subunit [Desulfatitalea sp.]NNK02392.1 molybdate ABC transporter permease subunit [Desulfatitalea sp.]
MSPYLSPLLLTLKVAFWATLAASLTGIALALWMQRRNGRGKDALDALLTLPMVLPPTVLGYYLIVVMGRRGLVGSWLAAHLGINLMFTWQGAAMAAAVAALPLVIKSARAAFESVDGNFEQAARTLGAAEWAIFLRISLPLAWRGVLAGIMLAFARAMGEFGATLMVAGNLPGKTQTLSTAIYTAVQAGRDQQAHLLVATASAVCFMILYGTGKLLRARRR